MLCKKAVIFSVATWVAIYGCLASSAFATRKEKVLYSFCFEQSCNGFQFPNNLILDKDGNLYGTTIFGGTNNDGVVFQLTPEEDGTWSEKELYSFCSLSNCADGSYPSSGLIFDSAGNLYGVTEGGGTAFPAVAYQLAPGANGTWTERVLHTFAYGEGMPWGSLIFDAAGNLYGATLRGGNLGTVFELMPQGDRTWRRKVLHTFQGGDDGNEPFGPLVFDASGNLYGATTQGGTGNGGTVYELMPQANGTWGEKVLHEFGIGSDGRFPNSVILDAAGSLYGTTRYGGVSNDGMIFRLTPGANGRWKEKVLHSFHYFYDPGAVIFDAAGNLYGPIGGGPGCPRFGCGGVFQFKATGSYAVISTFGHARKGDRPDGVILDATGNLYGTTTRGGADGDGVVFEVMRCRNGPDNF
jgi:uncharacterized repeat protein (TIGR03803 family)